MTPKRWDIARAACMAIALPSFVAVFVLVGLSFDSYLNGGHPFDPLAGLLGYALLCDGVVLVLSWSAYLYASERGL